MSAERVDVSPERAALRPVKEVTWERFGFFSLAAIRPFVETVVARMTALDYSGMMSSAYVCP